ncbi:MAG: type II toxin-antitoxin system RelB/DinJ family antitoxin [Erysipelotrichaceae bacterium]
MPNVTTNIRIDADVKKKSAAIFNELGMDMTTAVNIFLRQTIRHNGLPFDLKLDMPNKETIEAIHEVEIMKKNPDAFKSYSNVDMMIDDLLK